MRFLNLPNLTRKMSCRSTFSLIFFTIIVFLTIINTAQCKKDQKEEKKTDDANKWKKKDVRDYTDADVERLFDQWEDGDEDELEDDELPEWKREPPKIDMSQINPDDPEGVLKMSKKGRTLMLFATVSGKPSQSETEKITQIWQGSLFNANIETQRYVVSEDRVIFMLKDGAMAWEIKDYLTKQDRCEEVTIEGKSYPGKGAKDSKEEKGKSKKSEKSDSKKDKKAKTEL